MDQEHTSIWIDRGTWEQIKIAATKRRISMKRFIQLAVQDYLRADQDGQQGQKKKRSRGER